jgi:hypothetical protein
MRAYPDEYLMLDSDMFPVATVPLEKYRSGAAGAWALQTRPGARYVWPNLFFVDMRRVPFADQLAFDVQHGTDTGGAAATWLSNVEAGGHGIYWFPYLSSCTWGAAEMPASIVWRREALLEFCEADVRNAIGDRYWCEIYDDVFFHYRAGSNWNGEGAAVHRGNMKRLMERLLGE